MTSEQRVAVVTGGTGAIGGAIVTALDAAGHRTVVLGHKGGDVQADLASQSATRSAATEILERYGRVDVLVHCAAVIDQMRLRDLDMERWRRIQAVNVEAGLLLAQAFAPGMAERRFGRIVFVASDTLWSPPGGEFLPYVASKGAMVGVVRALAVDLGADGIAVTAVAPGLTDTPAARSVNEPGQL